MRIAVIGGAGGMGSVTTADAATSDGVEQVILVDRDEAGAARLAAAHAKIEVRVAAMAPMPCARRSRAPTRLSTRLRTASTSR